MGFSTVSVTRCGPTNSWRKARTMVDDIERVEGKRLGEFDIIARYFAPHGHAVLRLGAKQGDRLYVSGTIGDAHLGLRVLKQPGLDGSWDFTEKETEFVVERYRRPQPRNDLTLLVRNFAQAAIDVSDGL